MTQVQFIAFGLGVVVAILGAWLSYFSFNTRKRYQKGSSQARGRVEQALEILRRGDRLTDDEREYLERELTRLTRMDSGFISVNQILTWLAALAGLAALIIILIAIFFGNKLTDKLGAIEQLGITPADAASMRPELAAVVPIIALFILGIMGAAFVGSIVLMFFVEDKPENQARLRAASDIVKTFGGFFTGIATSLLGGG